MPRAPPCRRASGIVQLPNSVFGTDGTLQARCQGNRRIPPEISESQGGQVKGTGGKRPVSLLGLWRVCHCLNAAGRRLRFGRKTFSDGGQAVWAQERRPTWSHGRIGVFCVVARAPHSRGSLKGCDTTAQGEALGRLFGPSCRSPVRAESKRASARVPPLQGSRFPGAITPRAAPWAVVCRPFRPERKKRAPSPFLLGPPGQEGWKALGGAPLPGCPCSAAPRGATA